MQVLLPVSRYRVTYSEHGGRPYGEFEKHILRAIGEGVRELDQLQRLFCLHTGLLIEALVTLTRAGWIAFGSDSSFALTMDGRKVVAEGGTPSELSTYGPLHMFCLVEQLTGALTRSAAATYVSTSELKRAGAWDKSIRLPAARVPDPLPSEVAPHIHLRPQRWLGSVGPIQAWSQGSIWIVFDCVDGCVELSQLPAGWAGRLEAPIADRLLASPISGARKLVACSADSQRHPAPERRPQRVQGSTGHLKHALPIGAQDLVWGYRAHDLVLKEAFTSASSNILISSAFVDPATINRLAPRIERALKRGVQVDILWGLGGARSVSESDLLSCLKKLRYDLRDAAGNLSFNSVAANSHAKFLAWDPDASPRTAVGSYDWLSTHPLDGHKDRPTSNVSVSTSNPAVVARIARVASDLWQRGDASKLSSGSGRWRHIARSSDRARVESGGNSGQERSVITGPDHQSVFAELLGAAQRSVVVLSHKLGPIAQRRIEPLLTRLDQQQLAVAHVAFEEATADPAFVSEISKALVNQGGSLEQRPSAHAKVLQADEYLCVGSYNLLSTDPHESNRASLELGILCVLEDAGAVSQQLRRVSM